ncbi:hypothetical protein Ocin01_08020 [Orchesella cincta]|uniref:Uncharacterized protein n=1 Tax=Orchesella cincta TaxID=48709 RepID=A0A1D2N023_ORCCI|nr:hypothetical protein Ocin01_08020 [Orchesella cincta]
MGGHRSSERQRSRHRSLRPSHHDRRERRRRRTPLSRSPTRSRSPRRSFSKQKQSDDGVMSLILSKLNMLENRLNERDSRTPSMRRRSSSRSSSGSTSSVSDTINTASGTKNQTTADSKSQATTDASGQKPTDPSSQKSADTVGQKSTDPPEKDIVVTGTDENELIIDAPFDQELLDILGAAPVTDHKWGESIPDELAVRWKHFSTKGIEKEARKALFDSYEIPSNCTFLLPPKLNPELNSKNEAIQKKEIVFRKMQEQLGHALAAFGKSITLISKSQWEGKKDAFESLVNGAKMLTDIHHSLSASRQHTILFSVQQNIKKVLEECEMDEFLFGSDLGNRLKTAKELEKVSNEVRISQPKPQPKRKSQPKPQSAGRKEVPLNSKGPVRQQVTRRYGATKPEKRSYRRN